MFKRYRFEHEEYADWSRLTHVKIRPGARADTQNGRDILDHIKKVADKDGVAEIRQVLKGFPPKRKDLPVERVARTSLRHMANERSSGKVNENKGVLWLGWLEPNGGQEDPVAPAQPIAQVRGADTSSSASSKDQSNLLRRAAEMRGSGGEGEDHLRLKLLAAASPQLFGAEVGALSETEYALPSGDRVDVVFLDAQRMIAVEVKPASAPESDLVRGLFQCIKYAAVMQAMVEIEGLKRKVRAILCVGRQLPPAVDEIREGLGVDVVVLRTDPGTPG